MIRLIIKAALLFIMIMMTGSCKNDKPITQPTEVKPVNTKVAKGISKRPKPSYDHYNTSGLEWISLQNALNDNDLGSKKTLVDVYTEWCSWCKIMDKKTFADPEVQKYLKENFNLVKFDAESQEELAFKGEKFQYKEAGKKGMHLLAAELLEGQMSYPSLVFFDEKMEKIRLVRGYKNPAEFIQELEIVTSL